MKAQWWMGVAIAALVGAPAVGAAAAEPRTVEIAVTTKGFDPAHVKVTKGQPLKLVVTRKTDDTCGKEIVIPDENIRTVASAQSGSPNPPERAARCATRRARPRHRPARAP